MTEDDTFKILKRPSYSEMRNKWVESDLFMKCISFPRTEEMGKEIDEFFKSYGWCVNEYSNFKL